MKLQMISTSKKSAKFRRCEILATEVDALVSILKLAGQSSVLEALLEQASKAVFGESIELTDKAEETESTNFDSEEVE